MYQSTSLLALKFLVPTTLGLFRRACISISAVVVEQDIEDVILLQFKGFWGCGAGNPLSINVKFGVEIAVAGAIRVLFKLYVVSFICKIRSPNLPIQPCTRPHIFILTCFHLTNFFGKERLNYLAS